MGCMFSHAGTANDSDADAKEDSPPAKQYSWDKRESIKQKDYTTVTVGGLQNDTLLRTPGSINGQQLMLQNCQNCIVFVLDNIGTAAIEDCSNCTVFLGPAESSVLVRGCRDCKLMLSCRRLRIRDSSHLVVFICCPNQPQLESSTDIRFGPYQFYYPQLEDEFHISQLSVYNNKWHQVVDATPPKVGANFSLLPETTEVSDIFPLPEWCLSVEASIDKEKSIVPYVPPVRTTPYDKSCFVTFFSDGLSHERARTFIHQMREKHPDCVLVQSRELSLQDTEAQNVFSSDKYAMAITQGPVIGLEYSGPNSVKVCQETLVAVSKGSTGLVFVSSNHDSARKQVDTFCRLAEAKTRGGSQSRQR